MSKTLKNKKQMVVKDTMKNVYFYETVIVGRKDILLGDLGVLNINNKSNYGITFATKDCKRKTLFT